MEYLSKAGELAPESSGAYINLGVSLKALGRVSEAIDAYYKAVNTNPLPQARIPYRLLLITYHVSLVTY